MEGGFLVYGYLASLFKCYPLFFNQKLSNK